MEIFKSKDNAFLFVRETQKDSRFNTVFYTIAYFCFEKDSSSWWCGAFAYDSNVKHTQSEFIKLFNEGEWDTSGWSCGDFKNFEDAAEECFGDSTKFTIKEWSKIWRLSKEMEDK